MEEPTFRPDTSKTPSSLKGLPAPDAPLVLQDVSARVDGFVAQTSHRQAQYASDRHESAADPRETAMRLHAESARMVERGVARVEAQEKVRGWLCRRLLF